MPAGTRATVQAAKRNRFGRVDYVILPDGWAEPVRVLLEELLDRHHWTGPGTTTLYTGRAAEKLRKQEAQKK